MLTSLALAVGLAPGCAGGNGDAAADPAATPAVRAVDGRLVDAHGRQLVLRGVNVKAEGLFDATFDDGRRPTEQVAPFDRSDAEQIARLGFDFVRLCVSWSGLEPTEGQFSAAAFSRLDEVVGWLIEAGLYVLIDFHEDAWSKDLGEDGAPLWATLPPPTKLLEGPLWPGPDLECPCTGDLGERRASLPVLAAFASFFENREQIQERFVPVWQRVAGRYAREPGVIGYEAMNEPVTIHVAHGADRLEDFHRRMVAALREVSPRQAYFLEPDVVTRNLLWTAPGPREPFPDGNVVYAAHLYPYSFPGEPSGRPRRSSGPSTGCSTRPRAGARHRSSASGPRRSTPPPRSRRSRPSRARSRGARSAGRCGSGRTTAAPRRRRARVRSSTTTGPSDVGS
ncbi:MAG: cellulase family glycosylhydrolase [Deltaproteobacteria bacterium]|nr:cellulase family glycosylhydrolase [Deltaproteobacteria bacterium]